MANLHSQDYKIKFKQGVAANINADATKRQAVEGEPHWTTDTNQLYVFDGTQNVRIYTADSDGNITLGGNNKIIGGTATTADLTLQTTSGVGATGADMHFLVGNNGATEAITILNNGNIGIGTTSPGAKLEIASGDILLSNNQALQIKDTGGAVRNVIKVTNADLLQISGTKSGDSTVGQIAFYTGDTSEKMRIDQNGNVGIGTASPGALLEVEGATRPRIMLDDGSTQKGRWGANDDGVFFLSNNINYDGTNWNLDSTSDEGIIAVLRNDGATNGRFEIVTAPAAANPATLSTRFSVWENGDVALGGSITSGALTGATIVAKNDGNVGIGVTSPTAYLHLKAGTATANTAPLKFNSGTLNTTAEAGAMEFLTDALYFTITTGAARKTIAFETGVSGTFTTADAKTVTVTNGLITAIV